MSTTMSPSALVQQKKWRYATKKFDASKQIPADVWAALEESLILTPSSFGLQPWKFIIVTDMEVRKKLVAVSWGQTQPVDCAKHVVFATRTELSVADIDAYLDCIVAARGGTLESLAGYRKMMVGFRDQLAAKGGLRNWAAKQVYIALGNFMTSAAALGVDACPMEGIDQSKYDEILGLTGTGYTTEVACAAGYRAADDKYAALAKVRFPASKVVQHI